MTTTEEPTRHGWTPPTHDSAIWAGWRHHPPTEGPTWVPCWRCNGQRIVIQDGRRQTCPRCLGVGDTPETTA